MTISSRRHILGATAAGAVLAATGPLRAAEGDVPGIGGDPGPRDMRQVGINPGEFTPPPTDHGNLGTMKYSFSQAHNRRTDAGWAREVTVRNFPISKSMAGVNMRLVKGAVRELHWHLPSEWAFMVYGKARITAVDQDGRKFVADVSAGDFWFFPSGIPHSIQGLEPDGAEFVLAFNDGSFSEDSTFLLTDWIDHTPRDVLARNFGVDPAVLSRIPPKELYIFNAPLPGSLADDLRQSPQPEVPLSYAFSLSQAKQIRTASGMVHIVDVNTFKASTTTCAALVEIAPGGLRELHWHPLADEWQYYISGEARMTVFASEGHANTVEFAASDVGYVPRAMGHYVENIGHEPLRFLEVFPVGQYADISLTNWLANTPLELVAAHLNIDPEVLRRLPTNKTPVVPA